jgi:3-isopropylmalate/(R)-2-methylmalate dehydratase large subunit
MLLAERGLVRPGMLVAGGDSHTPMAGAFGAYAAGYGATDMAAIAATGRTWLQVPKTIRVEWRGTLSDGVTAKDMMLLLCRELGMDNAFRAVEFAGPTVEAMSMPERLVLTNMAADDFRLAEGRRSAGRGCGRSTGLGVRSGRGL